MIAALLLATASLPTAVDAERAFAADAAKIGVWTAFRQYAAEDAVMFNPQAVWVQLYLKDRKDPAQSFDWWPTQSYVACDRRTAVNVGDAVDSAKQPMSHFTTVWQRQNGRWRWVYDGGASVTEGETLAAKSAAPKIVRASCRGHAPGAPIIPPLPMTDKQARKTPEDSGRGQSADRTLGYDWRVEQGGKRHFRVYLWNGRAYDPVIDQTIPAPQ